MRKLITEKLYNDIKIVKSCVDVRDSGFCFKTSEGTEKGDGPEISLYFRYLFGLITFSSTQVKHGSLSEAALNLLSSRGPDRLGIEHVCPLFHAMNSNSNVINHLFLSCSSARQ
jgi:hypothetical protein